MPLYEIKYLNFLAKPWENVYDEQKKSERK